MLRNYTTSIPSQFVAILNDNDPIYSAHTLNILPSESRPKLLLKGRGNEMGEWVW